MISAATSRLLIALVARSSRDCRRFARAPTTYGSSFGELLASMSSRCYSASSLLFDSSVKTSILYWKTASMKSYSFSLSSSRSSKFSSFSIVSQCRCLRQMYLETSLSILARDLRKVVIIPKYTILTFFGRLRAFLTWATIYSAIRDLFITVWTRVCFSGDIA